MKRRRRWWDALRARVPRPPKRTILPAEHEATWGNATVYFVFTIPTKERISLGRSVKRLLDAEFARVAAWPSDTDVRLSPSLANVDRHISKLQRMRAWMTAPSWRSGWALLRHPDVAVRLLLAGKRLQVDTPVRERMENTLRTMEKTLLEQQGVVITERRLDRNHFGRDAPSDSYVRLELRQTYHTMRVGGVDHEMVMEPRMLLHRDGVVQTTVGLLLPAGVNTTALVNAARPDFGVFLRSEIPEPYAPPGYAWVGGDWVQERDAGERLRLLEHAELANIYEWMEIAATRTLQLIDARQDGNYLCYPVVIAEAGTCCESWEENHHHDILRAAARANPAPGEQLTLDAGPNMAVTSGLRIHATLASAFILQLRAWDAGVRDLVHLLLFERIVLLYIRLRSLERALHALDTTPKALQRTYRAALELEQEARGANIHAGTARTVAFHVQRELGVPALLDVIGRGMTMLGERAATRASERAARAAALFAVLGLVVAFIAAVPAIPEILRFIDEQRAANPDGSAWAILQGLVTSPLQLSIAVLVAATAVAIAVAGVLAVRLVRVFNRIRKRGYTSRVKVSFASTKPDDGETEG